MGQNQLNEYDKNLTDLALFHLSPASKHQVIGGEGFLVEIPIFSTGCVL